MKTRERRQGITLVHTGTGKGKSSGAFGVVFRAAGWGLKVCVIQFIKGKWKTGEQIAAEKFDNIEWHTMGDGFTWDTKNPAQDIKTSHEIWDFSRQKILSKKFDLVLLDEINYCSGYGWISGEEIAEFIKTQKPKWLHLLLTGRDAPQAIIDAANTVTEMTKIKHAFDEGILAAQGVEF
ncbi:cob(I)yrinic acid a,c-diamide adenosyltransferase [Candidatus Spongiihabitans sp.]|uniref:cob(I)yrinic acid a,c-diamide adenosyltransferase n=1 Tax=Candidatus Spongiihabitans sp. TaxID=3101308 RepID=UPI003C7CC413